jgi:hypothetical protein
MENVQITDVNIVAHLNIFEDKPVVLVKMHTSESRPKQFEDSCGNLWYPSELSNFYHIKP